SFAVELAVDREAFVAEAALRLDGEARTDAVEVVAGREFDERCRVHNGSVIILTEVDIAHADAQEVRPAGVAEVASCLQIENVDGKVTGCIDGPVYRCPAQK